MSKHDLQGRPVYHRMRDSIEAHLTVVFAAMVVSHWIEHQIGWSIRNLCAPPAATARCRSRPGRQILTAADPLPDDPAEALANINSHNVH
jgi:hypothetical protein